MKYLIASLMAVLLTSCGSHIPTPTILRDHTGAVIEHHVKEPPKHLRPCADCSPPYHPLPVHVGKKGKKGARQ